MVNGMADSQRTKHFIIQRTTLSTTAECEEAAMRQSKDRDAVTDDHWPLTSRCVRGVIMGARARGVCGVSTDCETSSRTSMVSHAVPAATPPW